MVLFEAGMTVPVSTVEMQIKAWNGIHQAFKKRIAVRISPSDVRNIGAETRLLLGSQRMVWVVKSCLVAKGYEKYCCAPCPPHILHDCPLGADVNVIVWDRIHDVSA